MPKIAFYRTQRENFWEKVSAFLRFHENIWEYVKWSILILWFMGNVIFYGVYTNITSTKGYFLTEAKKEREQAEFAYSITKLNTIEYQRKLREKLHQMPNVAKIDFHTTIVYIDEGAKQVALERMQETKSN